MNKIKAIIEVSPFSINRLFRSERYKKKEYRKYVKNALLLMPKKHVVDGQVAVFFRFYCRSNRLRLDNLYSVALNLLTEKHWIHDSSYVHILRGQKILVKSLEEEKIEVNIIKI